MESKKETSIYQSVDRYIKKVISDSCAKENRPNDVQYQFCIIEDNIIFELNTRYNKVSKRIFYRLEQNSMKNFGLKFNKDFQVIYSIDPNYTIDRWDVFGEFATVIALGSKSHLLPKYSREGCGEYIPSKQVEEILKLRGVTDFSSDFEWDGYSNDSNGWTKYLEEYKMLYGEDHKSLLITC